jgi:uncharacterized protein
MEHSITTPSVTPSPVGIENRIKILDSLRGMALLGILMMNIPFFGRAFQLHYNLDILGEYSGPNYWCWWIVNGLFEGTMRAIFSMLFGAGAILLLDRMEKKPMEGITPADIYYRRLIWLLIFGLINAYIFLWPGDILYTYAITGLFLFPFRKLSATKLALFGAVFMLFATIQSTSKIRMSGKTREKGEIAVLAEKKHRKLTDKQKKEKEEWVSFQENHSIAHFKSEIAQSNKNMQKGYVEIQSDLTGINKYIETTDFYTELFFDALAFFLIGMALFKTGYLSGNRSFQEYAAVALISYGIGLPISYWIGSTAIRHHFDPSLTWQEFKVSLYHIKRLLMAMGHISFVLILYKLRIAGFLLKALSNVGQMAFTNYLMQSLICTFIFYGYGLALFGKLERYQLYEVVAAVWIFQIALSAVWLRFFRFGPFEWLWRSLTYWKRQPFLTQKTH